MRRGNIIINEDEARLLLKVAHMYYEKDMNQSEISKELGIYRTTISRMLKKIREEGIVKVSIDYSIGPTFEIEQQLISKFGLKEAIVVPIEEKQTKMAKLQAIGQTAARYIDQIIEKDDVVGFSWGSTLASVVDALEVTEEQNAMFVPLVGGPTGKLESQFHVNTIVYKAAQKYMGKSLLIDLPAIIQNEEAYKYFVQSPYFQQISEFWNHLTIAVVGIGSMAITGNPIWSGFYGDEAIQELERGKVVGDICSQFYDQQGRQVKTSITDRTIAINLDLIKKARYSIGVAESLEKVPGIIGALNGHYLDVLVTTEETAREILKPH